MDISSKPYICFVQSVTTKLEAHNIIGCFSHFVVTLQFPFNRNNRLKLVPRNALVRMITNLHSHSSKIQVFQNNGAYYNCKKHNLKGDVY